MSSVPGICSYKLIYVFGTCKVTYVNYVFISGRDDLRLKRLRPMVGLNKDLGSTTRREVSLSYL